MSLSEARICVSQVVRTEIVPIADSANEKSRTLTTVQFYVQENLNLDGHFLDLQESKDLCAHLRNLPNQTHNLNEVQVICEEDCYNIHHPFEFKKSEVKAAPWAVKSKSCWALRQQLLSQQQHQLQIINQHIS